MVRKPKSKKAGAPSRSAGRRSLDTPPQLFAWGRDGVPGGLRQHLFEIDIQVREERGEQINWPLENHFAEEGVTAVAQRLHAKLLKEQAPGRPKGLTSKLRAEIADWCYALHAYCAMESRPAPAALLWLTFDALGLTEHRPSPEITKAIGAIEGVSLVLEFIEAARLDRAAIDEGRPLPSVSEIAQAVGASRRTVARWRKMPSYQKLRRSVFPHPPGHR